MENAKTQLADKIKSANNILVTVSRDPSVDQLAACIGLALLLNKLDKHTAAVFSGQVPSTLEFLKPEETLEKNTDSLRDFIIALDKSKADKLRYKVENDVVRIFITPYRTSISQDDLEFSQGDFNVDLVIALGVRRQEDLDQAITAHGRILHDATVASITTTADSGLGSINWHDPQASSLSELATDLGQTLGENSFDNQIATALLTGIVAETNRFSNDKTSSQTMSASAALMAAGANQQLVATKLQEAVADKAPKAAAGLADNNHGSSDNGDGTLAIDHHEPEGSALTGQPPFPPVGGPTELPPVDDTPPSLPPPSASQTDIQAGLSGGPRLMTAPPTLGGMLSANTQIEGLDPTTDPLSLPAEEPRHWLEHEPPAPPAHPAEPPLPATHAKAPTITPTPPPEPPAAPPPPPAPSPEPEHAAPPAMVVPPSPVADSPAVHEPASPPPATPFSSSPPSSFPLIPTASSSQPAEEHPMPDIPQAIINSEPTTPTAPPLPGGTSTSETANKTLSDIEASVDSSHLGTARDEVSRALNSSPSNAPPPPIQALNAQPLGDALHSDTSSPASSEPAIKPNPVLPLPDQPEEAVASDTDRPSGDAPPPVPPPIPFQFGSSGDDPAM
jgi:hypothetical protein